MAVTLSQLITRTRMLLDEVSAADWSDEQITTELNASYMDVYTAVVETFEDYYRTVVQTDLVSGENEYSLPDDFYKMRRLEIKYLSTEDRVKAVRFEFEQMNRQYDSSTWGTTSRPQYELSGNYIRILPLPNENITNGIRMIYIATVPELSNLTDEINIPFPEKFWKVIRIGAAADLLRKGQQEETVAAKYDIKFEKGIEKMKQELEERYAEGTKYIMDTTNEWIDFNNPNVY